jgi:uncharacterized membrane protein
MKSTQRVESPASEPRRRFVNVGSTERKLSVAVGSALAVLGLSRRSLGGAALAVGAGGLVYRGLSGHCPAYRAVGINTNNDDAPAPEDYFDHGIHVRHSVTINKQPAELFRIWRELKNLPTIMSHLKSVTVRDDKTSQWTATGPAGTEVSWDAQIINEEPDALIAWQSLPGADVDNAGSVRFVPAPGDRGTELVVTLDYMPPAGQVGRYVAKLFGQEPMQQLREDLRRFKQKMETGVIPTTQGQPRGQCC